MTADGILTIYFNKPIIKLDIVDSAQPQTDKRVLQSDSGTPLEDFIEIRVKDLDDENEVAYNKTICGMKLNDLTETMI